MAEKKEKRYVSDDARLISEWHWEKNTDIAPSKLTLGSNKKVWWVCQNGHEWQAMINNRSKGRNCPYCSGRKVLEGYNDLQTIDPIISAEWNYEKNGALKPESFTAKSNRKVWWKCNKGHEWQTTIAHRNEGNGCPVCLTERHTSFPEYALVYYLENCGMKILHSYKGKGYELDIYIPSHKIAIEYDGYYWHKNKFKQDLDKNSKCKKDGIKLFRIREGLSSLNDSSIDYIIQRNQTDLSITLERLLKEITQISVAVDLKRDALAIENLREFTEKEGSILYSNPTLANEWNYEKNGKLKPENFLVSSNKKVWWKCQNGHEWQATINHRSSGTGCPYCSGKRVLKGYNDLQTVNPTLAAEWNHNQNGELRPETFTANSNIKVWWKCQNGHEWQATISHRHNGRGCPYCSGKKVSVGYNDLQTANSTIANEWNYEKNGDLKPEMFTANSGKKVWWKCRNGHEWQATIDGRNRGNGCPYCSSRKISVGYNDLQTVNPAIANEWNYEKNGDLKPEMFTANSHKKVWWLCRKGHEWQAVIYNRNNGRGCPVCAKKRNDYEQD